MSFFFTFPFARRPALFVLAGVFGLAALAAGPSEVRAQEEGKAQEERNMLSGVTDWMGLTAPTGNRPDFVRESRPDEKSMDFVPFVAPEKKRIPVKSPDETAADEAALLAQKKIAGDRLKKLNAEKVEMLPKATKPPPMTDKF